MSRGKRVTEVSPNERETFAIQYLTMGITTQPPVGLQLVTGCQPLSHGRHIGLFTMPSPHATIALETYYQTPSETKT